MRHAAACLFAVIIGWAVRRSKTLDYIVYFIVRVLICVVQAMPLAHCARAAKVLATLLHNVLKIRGRLVEENLRCAFPHLPADQRDRLAWQMWEHLFLMICEIAHAPRKIHDSNWRDYITLERRRELVGALLSDRPVVIVCGHYGNFELSGYLLGLLGFPSYTIARPLDNPYLDRFVNEFRGSTGQFILPKMGSAQRVDALLASGGTLAVLADQSAGPKGCFVNFFGRPASTHKAIALFSLGTDALLIVCYDRRVGKPLEHVIGLEAEFDPLEADGSLRTVPDITRWYTEHLEQVIRRAPEQYWWLHRRWKDVRPVRARTAA
jgi:Kdo2-lipid IVA lauroyltransferase/acyltransferase